MLRLVAAADLLFRFKIMKIVSWNVNSIKARLEHVKRFLNDNAPDVLMIQELKGLEFPKADIATCGYQSIAVTQKAYNGVAILSKHHIELIHNALPGNKEDEQARYLECDINGLRLINIYLPNGNPVDDGVKYPYKLEWMDRLITRLTTLREQGTPFAIGGDFNVIPKDRDCYDPKAWVGDAAFRQETWDRYRTLLNLGLTDAFRAYNTNTGQFSFWDYQRGAWQKDNGIRIDHFLLSPTIADKMNACTIDKTPRGWEKPSDHTPIILELAA